VRTMPPTLHPHLKRSLEFDDFHVDPKDVIENVSREQIDPAEQAAKRQRIEKIASQYLRGKAPVILSAGLRGPFDDGWKNPWAKLKKAKRKSQDKENGGSGNKAIISARVGVRKTRPAEAKRRTRSGNRKTLEEQAVASPETSRAVENAVGSFEECHTLEEVEIPAATAPSQEEHDISGATEFFSAPTERCVKNRSPLTNPFWLRRPESRDKFDMAKSTNGTTDTSPTRSKSTIPEPDKRRTLQLARPKVPVGYCAPPTKAVSPHAIRSSASASMVISSPVTAQKTSPKKPSSQSLTVVIRGDHPSGSSQQAHRHGQSQQGQPGTIPMELPTRLPQRDAMASPMPNSSTGFVYKKVGATKWSISTAPRSKPRAVNFSSSPANKMDAPTSKPSSQNINTVVEEEAYEATAVVAEEGPQPDERLGSQTEPALEQQSWESNQWSRQSAMSTQAAMVLAQLEFQESTSPASTLGTPRPWSQPEKDTPRPTLPEPSPAITPLSMFKPELEQAHSWTSVLRGPPISTQDLFAAASPFAFSTAKKKPEVSRSNLRMSTMSCDEQDHRGLNDSPKSPMSFTDRIPLKEKNIAPSPWNFSFDKGQHNSQDSLKDNTRRSISDVELPQLDFHTSLDDYGPHGSLHFTDRLLRNLDHT
jgi:hypothetical protein